MPKLTREFAKRQVGRLEALPFFPKTSDGIGELINSLFSAAGTEDRCKAITDKLTRFVSCPTPDDIFRVSVEECGKLDSLPPPCAKCAPQDGAWRYVMFPAGDGDEIEMTARCDCPRGKALIQLDRQRNLKGAAR